MTESAKLGLAFTARGRGDGSSLEAFLKREGSSTRVALFRRPKKIPPKLTKVAAPFTVEESGKWTIELVLPFVAGSGTTAWVDDFSLQETIMPPLISITQGPGFNDDPVTAACQDGSVYCAVLSFIDGKDVIRVFRVPDVSAESPQATALPDLALPGCNDVWRLAMASKGSDVWLAASCEVADNWDIYLWAVGPDRVGTPIRITDSPETDTNPSMAVLKDRVVVAWETNRDQYRQIMLADVVAGEPGEARRLSSADSANYYPSIAANQSGEKAWLVWESFRAGNYDIYGTFFDGSMWGAERVLSSDPRIEHRPAVAWNRDGAWMAWETMEYLHERYRTGRAAQQRIVVARLDDDGLKTTENFFDLYEDLSSYPSIACDPDGRVWVCARTTGAPVLQAFCGTNWTGSIDLSHAALSTSHRAQPSPLSVTGERLIVAIPHESGRPHTYYGEPFNSKWPAHQSNVKMVCIDLADMPPVGNRC